MKASWKDDVFTFPKDRELITSLGDFYRAAGGRVAFANGCFDILHHGHLDVIQKCRELVGFTGAVIVGLNDDASVTRLKGNHRPFFDLSFRQRLLVGLEKVDFVVSFDSDTPLELIECLKPDFIVKGGDNLASEVVGKDVGRVVIVPYRQGFSTTEILDRAAKLSS